MWYELDFEAMAREENAYAPRQQPAEVESLVVFVRLELYNRELPCGAAALRNRLRDHYSLRPLPSLRRIRQILRCHGLTHRRTGWYEGEEPGWLAPASRIPREERR